jgi:hypothetical protein
MDTWTDISLEQIDQRSWGWIVSARSQLGEEVYALEEKERTRYNYDES